MPIASIDPSMSIGFYCRDAAHVDELRDFLRAETAHLSYPLHIEEGCNPDGTLG